MTPEVLLWAHELKREQKNIWDRLKQLESAAPQQDRPDPGTSVAIEARISALERQSKALQAKHDAASGLEGRISDLETKFGAVDDLRKDTAAAQAKAEAASREAKGMSAAFSLLDAEVSDQAKEVKQIKDKVKTLTEGAASCNARLQEIEATVGETADRLNGLDNSFAAFQHDQQDISDDLLNAERKVAGLGKDMQETKDGMSNMLTELKWHLGQLYGHCEKIEIELGLEVEQGEGEAAAGSQEALPLETQPNLERRWDEECDSNVVSQHSADKPSPNTFKHRQRRTPADSLLAHQPARQKHAASASGPQVRAPISDSEPSLARSQQYTRDPSKSAPNSKSHTCVDEDLPPDPENDSLLLGHRKHTQRKAAAGRGAQHTRDADGQAIVLDSAVSQRDVRRPAAPQITMREEDIETQSPTPSPRPKSRQKRNTLQKETQLLLEPSIHSENRVLQPLTRRTRRTSQFQPKTATAVGKENVKPDNDSFIVITQQKARTSQPALASKGKKRTAPASKEPSAAPKKRRSQAPQVSSGKT